MSDHLHISSPLSSSPSRPSVLSRPHWPWTTYTHRSSQSSIHSTNSGTGSQTPWDSRSSVSANLRGAQPSPLPYNSSARQTPRSTTVGIPSAMQEETTRQWSFTAFEWIVRDVHKLRDYVEERDATGEGNEQVVSEQEDFEVLKESPMIGDGKFKLEIARTPLAESANESTSQLRSQLQTLSVYITSLMLDFPHSDFAMSATMMAAIKCQDDRVGERGARAEWVWEHWQTDWTFRQESEVWECPLPSLSSLLENPRVRETDSFVVCVQIHCPIGPFFPQQPSAYYVPRDLLDGLEASLDNANTGDVRFVCLERLNRHQTVTSPNSSPPHTARSKSRSSASSSYAPFSSQTTVRKRILYAHSDILIRRGDYWSNMFASAFSENPSGLPPGEKKVFNVVVEEADFVTIYWLLKWVYANWLLFKEDDDPRDAVEGVGAGWSANWLNTHGGEWDWKTFQKSSPRDDVSAAARDDARSTTSGQSENAPTVGKGKQPFQSSTTTTSPARQPPVTRTVPSKTAMTASSTARQSVASGSRRPGPASSSASSAMPLSISEPASSISRTKPAPNPLSTQSPNFASSQHYPISPRSQRQHTHPSSTTSLLDPHPHPTPSPEPASALSMYQIAHRYSIPGLSSLALEHMMSTITPQSSFPLLLATAVWEELHSLVEDYVVEKWAEVSASDEFEQCCQEIAAGEWGTEGGKTLMALFRRLRSPNVVPYTS